MIEKKRSSKDIWEKLDVIVKGVGAVLVSGAIAFYGMYSEKNQFRIAEANKRAQVFVQTMGNREAAAASMSANMFKTLMEHYFKKREDERTQVVILELIGHNFQHHLHLKPLFENLNIELKDKSDLKKQLRRAAKNVIRNEVIQIIGSGGDVCDVDLVINETRHPECLAMLGLTLLDVQEDYITISSNPHDTNGFDVSYFDMPLVDSSRLGELTYSVILSNTDKEGGKATVQIVILPEHYYSARNRLRFDEYIGGFLHEDISQ